MSSAKRTVKVIPSMHGPWYPPTIIIRWTAPNGDFVERKSDDRLVNIKISDANNESLLKLTNK